MNAKLFTDGCPKVGFESLSIVLTQSIVLLVVFSFAFLL